MIDDLEEFFNLVDEQMAAGKIRLQFWACPVDGHSDSDWQHPRETVRWDGDVARCTWPGCGRTSRDSQDLVPPGTMR